MECSGVVCGNFIFLLFFFFRLFALRNQHHVLPLVALAESKIVVVYLRFGLLCVNLQCRDGDIVFVMSTSRKEQVVEIQFRCDYFSRPSILQGSASSSQVSYTIYIFWRIVVASLLYFLYLFIYLFIFAILSQQLFFCCTWYLFSFSQRKHRSVK